MAITSTHRTFAHPSAGGRTWMRYVAAALSGVIGVTYLVLLLLVARAEAVPGAADGTTYGAYLFLAVPYLAGAWLLVHVDRRALWAVGAAVQVLVLALFVMFGIGMLGPGVFEYEALRGLRMEIWAAGITSAEVILLGLLCYLAFTPAGPGDEPGAPTDPHAQP